MKTTKEANGIYQALEGICYLIAIACVMDNSVFSFVGEGAGVLLAIAFTVGGVYFNRKNKASYNANLLMVGVVLTLLFITILLYLKFK